MSSSSATTPAAASLTAKWDEVPRKKWDALLASVPYAAYQQSYAFGEVVAKNGGAVRRVVVEQDRAPIALAQFAVRNLPIVKLATCLFGPVWLPGAQSVEARAAVLDLISKPPQLGRAITLCLPEGENEAAARTLRLRRVVSPYHTIRVDLTPDEDTLLSRLEGKWRSGLKKAQGSEIRVRPLGKKFEQYAWLLNAEAKAQRQKGYRAMPPALVPLWAEEAGRDSLFGLEAMLGTERIGGVMFFRHGNAATYHIGWSNDAGRAANATSLLLWQGMLALKKKGVGVLDLGGIDTDHAPGVARFKLGLGAPISQSGTWLLSPRLR